jgi:hypothetical protein
LVAGSGPDGLWLRKLDPSGSELWTQTYGDAAASDLAIDSADNIIVAGGVDQSFMVRKYDSNGTLLWHRTHDGPSPKYGNDAATAIAIDANQEIYAVGAVGYGPVIGDGIGTILIKYDANGNESWTRFPTDVPHPGGVLVSDQRVVVLASRDAGTDRGMWLGAYDLAGTQLWTRALSDSTGSVGLAADASGNLYAVAGNLTSKFDATGNQIWAAEPSTSFPGSVRDDLAAVTADSNGYTIAVGSRDTTYWGDDGDAVGRAAWLVKRAP